MSALQVILSPFVWLLTAFYELTGSYGLALILFALVVKLILFPFSLKGKKSMIKMNMLSGQMEKLKRQYGKDPNRYNMEVQKLYEKEHVNPMGGCLWSLIPLIILFPLYAIIRRPLFYVMGLDVDQIMQVAQSVDWSNVAFNMGWIKEAAEFTTGGYNELFLASLINESNVAGLQAISPDIFAINFDFLGVNLSQEPVLKFWTVAGGFGLFLLPVISAVTGFLSSLVSMKTNNVNKQAQQGQNGTSKMMLVISPLLSLWIGFSMPAALCVYWITNNLFAILQELLCGRILKKDYEKAAAAKAEAERLAKEEEKEEKRRKSEERARRIEEEKNNKGKKKKPVKKDEDDSKIPASVKEASREGMRQYARGRAYDPNRYGGPSAYTEYVAPVDPKKARQQAAAASQPEEKKAVPAPEAPAPVEEVKAPVIPETAVEPEAEAPYAEEAEAESEKSE